MPTTLRGKVILAITLHFFVALRRSPLHHVVRAPKIGARKTMNPSTIQSLRSAISESIAHRSVPTLSVPDIESAVAWIERTFVDVDWDPFPDRITIFGDDPSVSCDENGEGSHFVLNIIR